MSQAGRHFDESSKQRAMRIPLDYVHRMDSMQRGKLAATAAAVLLTIGGIFWAATTERRNHWLSHGPLANVHAAWDEKCATCHENYRPLRSDAADPLGWLRPAAMTSKCLSCHPGPTHHKNLVAGEEAGCTSCHRDHQGRTAEIARPDDLHCVRCHENIVGHATNLEIQPHVVNITSFSRDHPEFRSLAKDPGRIKFNHALHMTPGLPAPDPQQQGKSLMTLADLPAEFVDRYRRSEGNSTNDPIALQCSSCHRSEHSQALDGNAAAGSPSTGAYMLPVTYQRDCRACHPLKFAPAAGQVVAHGLSPQGVRDNLVAKIVRAAGITGAQVTTRFEPARPIPGRSPTKAPTPIIDNELHMAVTRAEQYLVQHHICEKCHYFQLGTTEGGPTLLPVEPASIPHTWLAHAKFDHGAHRAVACSECHVVPLAESQPASSGALGPRDQEIVMIKGRQTCLQCHSPRQADGTGGARHDCAECHRYHGADMPHRGSSARRIPDPSDRRSIEWLLSPAKEL